MIGAAYIKPAIGGLSSREIDRILERERAAFWERKRKEARESE